MPSRDLCCQKCKGIFQLCTDKTCFHHVEAERRELRDDRSLRLYADPTSRQAINNLTRRRTRGRRR